MKVTLHNTSKIVNLNGVPARVWEGETDSGIEVHAFITRIAVSNDPLTNKEQFEKELQSCEPPSSDVESYPLNLIL